MQADPSNKWNDKEFEDYAWSQMTTLLDEELPVAKKKRRAAFWLLLLVGLGLLLAIGVKVWSGQDIQHPEGVTATEDAVIADARSAIVKDDSASVTSPIATEEPVTVPTLAEKKTAALNGAATQDTDFLISTNKQQTDPTTENQATLPATDETIGIALADDSTNSQESITQSTYKDTHLATSELADELPLVAEQQRFAALPFLTSTFPPKAIPPTLPIDRQLLSIKRWRWMVTSGVLFPTNGNTHAYAGSQVSYQLTSKWQIGIGADYLVGRSGVVDFTSLDNAITGPLNMEEDMSTTATADMDSSSASVSASSFTDYLRLPLHIGYQFHPRWQVNTGIAYLLPLPIRNSQAMEADPSGQRNNGINSYHPGEPFRSETINDSWQWQTGIAFRATNRLLLQVQYQQQFDQAQLHPLRQAIQLGVGYRF